jgi:hypothetical protein
MYAKSHGERKKQSSELIKEEIDAVVQEFSLIEKKIIWVNQHIEQYQAYLTA